MYHKIGGIAILVTLIMGCANSGVTKEGIGTTAGAVAGGVIGSLFGKGSGKTAAILIGTAVGGFIGNRIGKLLDEKDREAVEQEVAKSLEQTQDGQTVAWSNPETGAKAEIQPKETRTVEKQVKIIRETKVASVPTMQLIGETYRAKTGVNVRTSPTTQAEVVAGLQEDERFTVVGKIETGNWYMVARQGRSIGYVYGDLIEPAVTAEVPQLREPVDLDTVELGDDSIVDTVAVKTECRTLEYQVTNGEGKSEQDSFQACKAADGAWELG